MKVIKDYRGSVFVIRIQEIKLPIDHTENDLLIKASEALKIKVKRLKSSLFIENQQMQGKKTIFYLFTPWMWN